MLLNRSVSEACVGSHNWTDAMLHKPYIKDNNIVDAQSPKVWTGPSLCRVEGVGEVVSNPGPAQEWSVRNLVSGHLLFTSLCGPSIGVILY